jgi:hypothetical protein
MHADSLSLRHCVGVNAVAMFVVNRRPSMPRTRAGRFLVALLIACLTHLGLLQAARAAVIDTQTLVQVQDRAAAISSAQAKLDRADVRDALVALGVNPDEAKARVAALTDTEIAQLHGKLDQLPAAGDGGWILLVVVLAILVWLFASGKLHYK